MIESGVNKDPKENDGSAEGSQMRPGVRPDERAARARARVALTGLTIAEQFRDEGQDVLLFIDNIFRFTPGRFGSVGSSRPYSFRCGLSADARHRHGYDAGAHYNHQQGVDHLGAGRLRSCR